MKSSVAVSLFLFFTCFAIAQEKVSPQFSSQDSTHAEFRLVAEQWRLAYNGMDAAKLAPFYAEDAQYISSHVAGLVASGRDRLIANFQKGMSGGGHLDTLEVLSVNVSCELASVLCKYDATNSGQKMSGRNLLILKKISGKWLIVLHMTVV